VHSIRVCRMEREKLFNLSWVHIHRYACSQCLIEDVGME
jgi:hypothetical protein